MQALDSGALNKCSGNEASSINFRPSPNFKHMKKYLKSKFEEDMNSGTSVSEHKIDQQNKVITAVQPPLPPNSPPPDSPLGFTVKQEVEDQEYERAERGEREDSSQEEFPGELAAPAPAGERPVMCKDFVRGTCTRGAACIYAHKLDLSQLDGVYRFCRDFENKRCVRPVCYFVHATTFEKEHFMRTGALPPHATAHLRSPAATAPPPPPPAQPLPQPQHQHQTDLSGGHSPMFANAPAALASGAGAGGGGATACAGAGALEARLPLDALPALPTVATVPAHAHALKRDWRDHHPFSSPPRDLDNNEPLAKKCKRCDLTELRLQHSKAQVAGMLRASKELDDKLDKVVSSNSRLHAMLKILLKPRRSLENMSNNSFLGSSRLSPADTDSNKEVLLSQMKVLLAKILLGSDGLPAENGRDLAT